MTTQQCQLQSMVLMPAGEGSERGLWIQPSTERDWVLNLSCRRFNDQGYFCFGATAATIHRIEMQVEQYA